MLDLQIDDKYIDLGDDFSFTMNLKSPIFNDLGSYSYPFKISNTSKNSKIFGFRHRIQSTTDVYKSNPGTFLWNGHPLFFGIVKMQTLDPKTLEGSIINSDSDFYAKAKKLNLNQFDYGDKTFATEVDAMWYLTNSKDSKYPDYPFACPTIFNDLFFDPPTTDPDLQLYNDFHGGARLWTLTTGGDRTIIIPMLYLPYVLSLISSQLGYKLTDELFTPDPELSRLVLYNSFNCNNGITSLISDLRFNNHIPGLLLIDFIGALEKYFCSATFIDGINKKIRIVPTKKIILDSSFIEFSKNILSIQTVLEDQGFGFVSQMDIDGDDPKMEYIKDQDDKVKDKIKGSVKTFMDLPPWPIAQFLDIYYVEDEHKYYLKDSPTTWFWYYGTYSCQSMFFFRDAKKEPQQTIETALSTLNYRPPVPSVNPPIEGGLICGNKGDDWEKIVPRILFALPTLAINQIDYFTSGMNESDNYSLFFPGAKGLFSKFWKEFLRFRLSTKLVKITKQMEFAELQNFDFSRKYMINGTKYLIKDIQVVLKKDMIMPAILECYPCP